MWLLLAILYPVILKLLSGLLGALSATLGMFVLIMGVCVPIAVFLGPWVFIPGLLWFAFVRISYDPSKEN